MPDLARGRGKQLPCDPLDIIAEVLGQPAPDMRTPAAVDYRCPFTDRQCSKQSHTSTLPYPVCAIYRRGKTHAHRVPQHPKHPICVCPIRFHEADLLEDIIRECWIGPPPQNPHVAHEVQMEKFGKVDMVVADVDHVRRAIRSFLPVELQAVDITGSYYPAYEALISSQMLDKAPSYGINWANVRKRFMSQLVAKGYYCHQWGTRVIAVIQEDLYEKFTHHASMAETTIASSNILFMLYQFERTSTGEWSFRLRRIAPTTHLAVMSSILYETPPSAALFQERILERI